MKHILITGGAGFIGCHLANKLSENNKNEIKIVDNLYSAEKDNWFQDLIKKKNVQYINIDLTDLNQLKEKIWNYYDYVYHLAAIVGVEECTKHPDRVLINNIKSTQNIENLVKEKRCKKILFSSSSEIYAGGYDFGIIKIPTDEKVPLMINDIFNPRWSYATSKIVGEQIFIFNSKNLYDYTIVRYHNIYGPRQSCKYVIPETIKRILAKESPFKVYGYNQSRDFCYIDDAVNLTIAAMESKSTNKEILNIGNGTEEINILELVKKIFFELNYDTELELINAPLGSVNRRCPDTRKIKNVTNNIIYTKLDVGLKKTIDWYLNYLNLKIL